MIPKFVGWLSREISVRVGALVRWRGSFFERRYDAAPVLDEDALVQRIRYLRQHGVKEGLVREADEWPGLTLIPELHHGQRRLFRFESKTQGVVESLPVLTSAPVGWETTPKAQLRERFAQIAREATEAARRERGDSPYLGAQRIVAQDPQQTPAHVARSPRVRCFASTQQKRADYGSRYREFVAGLRGSYDSLLDAWRKVGSEAFCLPGFGFCACAQPGAG